MVPLAEEVPADIGVPLLKVLVAGHLPHDFQHRPPALLLDGLLHHLLHHCAHILRVKEGYLEVRGQGKEGLYAPAPHLFHPFGPQGQGVGQPPHGGEARVVLFPAAEAEVGEGQRGHGVHGLVQECVAQDDFRPFGGGVQGAHAPGQPAEGGEAGEQVRWEHIYEGQVADGAVVGELIDSGHGSGLLSEINLPAIFYDTSIYQMFHNGKIFSSEARHVWLSHGHKNLPPHY